MKTFFLIFFIIIVLASDVYAANYTLTLESCEKMGMDPEICELLRDDADSPELQKELILLLISQGDLVQVYQRIEEWNKNLAFDAAPPEGENVKAKGCSINSGVECIKNAWLKVFSVTPSYREGEELYYPGFGKMQIGYYYELAKPNDESFSSPRCVCRESSLPTNRYGDCKTTFVLADSSLIMAYLNGKKFYSHAAATIGNNLFLVPPMSNEDSNQFSGEITITNDITATHYDWRDRGGCSGCCRWKTRCTGSGESRSCYTYCADYEEKYECVYSGQSSHPTILVIEDDLDAELYRPYTATHEIEVSYVDEKPNVVLTSNAVDYELLLNRISVRKYGSKYEAVDSYAPYNILTVGRTDDMQYTAREAYVTSATEDKVAFETFSHNIGEDCMLTYYHPFPHLDEAETECSITEKSATNLEVNTDDAKYSVGDKIEVEVRFKSDAGQLSVPVDVSYDDETKSVMTDASGYAVVNFEANKGGGEISASYSGDELQSSASAMPDSVYVSDKGMGHYLWFIIVLFAIYGLFYVYRVYGEAWMK